LEVAVDDALPVRGPERGRDLPADREQRRRVERLVAAHLRGQAVALEELHDEVGRSVGVAAHAVDLDHAPGLDHRRRPRLVEEALDDLLVLAVGRPEQLDRRLAPHQRVLGGIDHAESALADEARDLVAAQRLADHSDRDGSILVHMTLREVARRATSGAIGAAGAAFVAKDLRLYGALSYHGSKVAIVLGVVALGAVLGSIKLRSVAWGALVALAVLWLAVALTPLDRALGDGMPRSDPLA